MTGATDVQKGGGGRLQISEEGAQRFLVGLSWDARDLPQLEVKLADAAKDGDTLGKTVDAMMKPFDFFRIFFLSFMKLITFGMYAQTLSKDSDAKGRDKTAEQYDLDLDCYIFNAELKLQTVIGTEDNSLIDPSKKIYHTGDEQGGAASGDDEQIFVETKGLPPNYHHLFFTVKSDSKYHLGEFKNPSIRLADSKTQVSALQNSVVPEVGPHKAYNYVFCHIWRDADGWRFRNIDEFLGDDVEWEYYLPNLARA